jgi:hypothetical protein
MDTETITELLPINTLANKCGYFYNAYLEKDIDLNNGYNCKHPQNMEAPDCCYTFACPIAYMADYEEMLELDPALAAEYKEEFDRNGDIETDWMVYRHKMEAEL